MRCRRGLQRLQACLPLSAPKPSRELLPDEGRLLGDLAEPACLLVDGTVVGSARPCATAVGAGVGAGPWEGLACGQGARVAQRLSAATAKVDHTVVGERVQPRHDLPSGVVAGRPVSEGTSPRGDV